MKVKVYHQGEGPVNTIGAFTKLPLMPTMNLSEWGIVKGDGSQQAVEIMNWNGDPSPVVHQFNRFA